MSRVGNRKIVELVLGNKRTVDEKSRTVELNIPLTDLEKRAIGIENLRSPGDKWAIRVIVDKVLP